MENHRFGPIEFQECHFNLAYRLIDNELKLHLPINISSSFSILMILVHRDDISSQSCYILSSASVIVYVRRRTILEQLSIF